MFSFCDLSVHYFKERPWCCGRWQFRIFAAACPSQAMQFYSRLSCGLRLTVLSFQHGTVHVSAYSLGLCPFLFLLPVCLVDWASTGSMSHFTAAASELFHPGPCGGQGYRLQTQQARVNGAADGSSCWAANDTERARLSRSRQAAVLNAVSGVRPQEALLTAGVKTVLSAQSCSSPHRLHRDARWLGGFPHSSRATGDGGAPCCHNCCSTSGCWWFLVSKWAPCRWFD